MMEGNERPISILGFAGSLRKGSYNRMLLQAAAQVLPEGATLEIFDLEGIPPFNQDLEQSPAECVKEFKAKIRAVDALLIATPEYNYSVPGVLKNALDWASRPPQTSVLRKKPVGIVGASGGRSGTMRSQLALRQVFVFTGSYVMPQPEFLLADAAQKCDADGSLVDEETRDRLRTFLAALVDWTRMVGQK
jgi:chromate reductase